MVIQVLLAIHMIVAFGIICLVLMQQGKGSEMGAAFGGGSSQSLFGARGSANFLSRTTSIIVGVFFLSSLTLAYLYTNQAGVNQSVLSNSVIEQSQESIVPGDSAPASDAEQPLTVPE